MTAKEPISLWDASAIEADYRRSFDADGVVDVAIIGGGFTGLSTALHAGQKDLSCHVLEAEQIGYRGVAMETVSNPRIRGPILAANMPPPKSQIPPGPAVGPKAKDIYKNTFNITIRQN